MCSIRRATTDDLTALLPLMELLYKDERIPWQQEKVKNAMLTLFKDVNLGFVLVSENIATKQLLGYAITTLGFDLEFAGRDSFLTELLVIPEARRQGLGGKLIQAVIKELQAQNVKAVHLLVRPENEFAQKLYKKYEFALIPRLLMTKLL